MVPKHTYHANTLRMSLTAGVLFLAIVACNLTNPAPTQTSVATDTAQPAMTFTPVMTPTIVPTPMLATQAPVNAPANLQSTAFASCYLGSWALLNIKDVIAPVLAQNSIRNVQSTGSTGSMVLSFTPDSKMNFKANQYHSMFSGILGLFPINIDVLIDGDGSGTYTLDSSGSVLLSNPDFGRIQYSATAASIQMIPPTPLASLLPDLQVDPTGKPTNLNSSCNGDNLSFNSGSSSLPPLEFGRIK